MYVSSILVDRFGHRSRFQLDALSDGLNVVSGPSGSGKTTVVDFLRAIWTGFSPELRSRYLPPESRGFGGEVVIQTAQGRQRVSRYDDGGIDGHLTVERADGAVIGRRQVQDLVGNLSPELFDRAFLVDFQRRPLLSDLLRAADRQGLLRNSAPESGRVGEITRLLADIRDELSRWPTGVESYESLLRRRRELVDRLSVGGVPSIVPPALRESIPDRVSARARLMRLDRRLARWQRTLREVVTRRQRASERMERCATQLRPAEVSSARQHISTLEARLLSLQAQLDRSMAAGTPGPQLAEMQQTAQAMRAEVYQLCDEVTRLKIGRSYRRAARRVERLTRCETELRQAIRDLVRQRRVTFRTLAAAEPGNHGILDSVNDCQCSHHVADSQQGRKPTPIDRDQGTASSTLSDGADLSVLRVELSRIEEKLTLWERRRQRQADLEKLEGERQRLSGSPTHPNVISLANQYLQRLSSGAWREVRVADQGQILVVPAQGSPVAYSSLDAGSQDQAYLAFCLAIATECRRLGTKLPLVLNDVFSNYPSKQVRDSLEFLRDFGREHQVLCLTRHEHVVSVAKLLNVPIHCLPESEVAAPTRPVDLVSKGSFDPRALHAAQYDARAELWDADAFRGTTTALPPRETRLTPPPTPAASPPAPAAPRPAAPPRPESDPSDYLLHEHDPIEFAPSLDEHTATRLRTIGVPRVGDLIRIPASDIATEMGRGVSPEMVRSWQTQSRLMCLIRGLRPYDARILVACGIENPGQLARLSGSELRSRVKEFTASPEGQAVLLSGTESELSRVSDWLRGSQDRPSRELTPGDRLAPSPGDTERPTVDRTALDPRQLRMDRPHPDQRDARRHRERGERGDKADRRKERRASRPSTDGVVSLPGTDESTRFYLKRSSPVADAPTIGPSLAGRLEKVGVVTVEDLLSTDPSRIATALQMSRVNTETVRLWQRQAELVCRVPKLRGHDAQILVAAGVSDVTELAAASPSELWDRVRSYATSLDGKRAIRSGTEPTAEEVLTWIEWAQQARTLQAA